MSVKSAATILRQKMENGEFILAPGVYDGFSARIALQVGFDALYMVPYTWQHSWQIETY
jgi:2-methylisocitrate lyase-like PEP mutase family enzyme